MLTIATLCPHVTDHFSFEGFRAGQQYRHEGRGTLVLMKLAHVTAASRA